MLLLPPPPPPLPNAYDLFPTPVPVPLPVSLPLPVTLPVPAVCLSPSTNTTTAFTAHHDRRSPASVGVFLIDNQRVLQGEGQQAATQLVSTTSSGPSAVQMHHTTGIQGRRSKELMEQQQQQQQQQQTIENNKTQITEGDKNKDNKTNAGPALSASASASASSSVPLSSPSVSNRSRALDLAAGDTSLLYDDDDELEEFMTGRSNNNSSSSFSVDSVFDADSDARRNAVDFGSFAHVSRHDRLHRERKKRRKVTDINSAEIWRCPFHPCEKIYKRTSSVSINKHKETCAHKPSVVHTLSTLQQLGMLGPVTVTATPQQQQHQQQQQDLHQLQQQQQQFSHLINGINMSLPVAATAPPLQLNPHQVTYDPAQSTTSYIQSLSQLAALQNLLQMAGLTGIGIQQQQTQHTNINNNHNNITTDAANQALGQLTQWLNQLTQSAQTQSQPQTQSVVGEQQPLSLPVSAPLPAARSFLPTVAVTSPSPTPSPSSPVSVDAQDLNIKKRSYATVSNASVSMADLDLSSISRLSSAPKRFTTEPPPEQLPLTETTQLTTTTHTRTPRHSRQQRDRDNTRTHDNNGNNNHNNNNNNNNNPHSNNSSGLTSPTTGLAGLALQSPHSAPASLINANPHTPTAATTATPISSSRITTHPQQHTRSHSHSANNTSIHYPHLVRNLNNTHSHAVGGSFYPTASTAATAALLAGGVDELLLSTGLNLSMKENNIIQQQQENPYQMFGMR